MPSDKISWQVAGDFLEETGSDIIPEAFREGIWTPYLANNGDGDGYGDGSGNGY